MHDGVYWCNNCHGVFKTTTERQVRSVPCIHCSNDAKYLSTDVRPVFSRERRILQFYGHGHLLTEQVWRASKSTTYFINSESVRLPKAEQLKEDLAAIGDYIADS
jgi:phosphoadenosine phosphosulfate reductase